MARRKKSEVEAPVVEEVEAPVVKAPVLKKAKLMKDAPIDTSDIRVQKELKELEAKKALTEKLVEIEKDTKKEPKPKQTIENFSRSAAKLFRI